MDTFQPALGKGCCRQDRRNYRICRSCGRSRCWNCTAKRTDFIPPDEWKKPLIYVVLQGKNIRT